MVRLLPAAILLAGFAGTFVVSARPTVGVTFTAETTEPPIPAKPVGLAGCASSNCHGRSGGDASPDNAWRTSCTVWAAKDPHARAYDVLDPAKNAIAKKMQAKFDRLKPGYHPQKDARCLACHANPTLANEEKPELVALRSEGVSCEACHGNAENWIRTHTSTKMEDRHGLAELNDLGSRAISCAGCHVGGPGRDMNHDMIAAGHPKLNFEFASHLARMPKHWNERDRLTGKPRGPGYLLQAWKYGQFAAAEAACQLSMERGRKPGPELAEWNCYSCHHELLSKSWRPEAGFRLGANAWSLPWPLGEPNAAKAFVGLGEEFGPLFARVSDNRATVREAALKLVGTEYEVYRKKQATVSAANAADTMFQAIEATKTILDWDTGYRIYLTLGVLETVRRETEPAENTEIATGFRELEKTLSLPDHPKESTFDPKEVHARIVKLKDSIKAAWPK